MNNENAAFGCRKVGRRQRVTALPKNTSLQHTSPSHTQLSTAPAPVTFLPRASTTSTLLSFHKTLARRVYPSFAIPPVSSDVSSPASRPRYQQLFQKGAHGHLVTSADPLARASDGALGKGTALQAAGGDVCQGSVLEGEKWRPDMTSHQGILRGLLGSLGKLHACERSVAASTLRVQVGSVVSRGRGE